MRVSRLAVRQTRTLYRAALRRYRGFGRPLQAESKNPVLPDPGTWRSPSRLPRPSARTVATALGPLRDGRCSSRRRVCSHSLQLAPDHGEFAGPGARGVAPSELLQLRGRPDGKRTSPARAPEAREDRL